MSGQQTMQAMLFFGVAVVGFLYQSSHNVAKKTAISRQIKASNNNIDGLFRDFDQAYDQIFLCSDSLRDRIKVSKKGNDEDMQYELEAFFTRLKKLKLAIRQINCHSRKHSPRVIVIEGLVTTDLYVSVSKMYDALGIQQSKTPSDSLDKVRTVFDDVNVCVEWKVKRAFYTLSNYILMDEMYAECEIHERDLVYIVDRYYCSTLSYTIAKDLQTKEAIDALPQFFFQCPKDLLSPHLILVLDLPESVRKARLQARETYLHNTGQLTSYGENERSLEKGTLGERIIYVMLKMNKTQLIDASPSKEDVLKACLVHMKHLLDVR